MEVGEAAGAEILSGALACAGCAASFPINGGLPRLAAAAGPDRRSARSFGFQWRTYREGDRTWFKDDAEQRRREFLFGVDHRAAELAGRSLLDAGCGNGELTRALGEYGCEVVAFDFSSSVDGARRRLLERAPELAERVHYLQADVLRPPLRPASFDLVHSSGVLHHTRSTAEGIAALARLVRPGGRLYVQLYRRRPGWIHAVNVTLRAVTTRLPLPVLYALCLIATPAHSALSALMHALRREPLPARARARERALQMFDNYSPRYQHRHTPEEIFARLRDLGFENVREVTLDNERRHMLAVLGEKPARS